MERHKSSHSAPKQDVQNRSSKVQADSSASADDGLASRVEESGPSQSKRRKPGTVLDSPPRSGENDKYKASHRAPKQDVQNRSSRVHAESSASVENGLASRVEESGPSQSKRRKPATVLMSPSTYGENDKYKGLPSYMLGSSAQKSAQTSADNTELIGELKDMVETRRLKVGANLYEEDVGDPEVSTESNQDTAGTEDGSKSNGRLEEPGSCQENLPLPEKHSSSVIHLASLNGARGSFTDTPINCRLPCTAGSNTTCQIVHHLPILNEFLCMLHLELKELPCGQLSLSPLYNKNHRITSTQDDQRRAGTLLHWLLKTHRCVVVVKLQYPVYAHQDILVDALKDNPFIKSFTCSSLVMLTNKDICLALPTLKHLEEFEISDCPQSDAAICASVSLLIHKLTSLTCLKISLLEWPDNSVRKFVEALKAHLSLKELSIHESVVMNASPATMELFANYVESSAVLKTFSVQSYYRQYQYCLCKLLSGLLGNRSITKLVLKDFPIYFCVGGLISQILKRNEVLRSLIVTSTNRHIGRHLQSERGPIILQAFLLNNALEEVTLPVHIWHLAEWEVFLKHLPHKASLKNITIEMDAVEYPFVPTLCKALKESGSDGKVLFKDRDVLGHQIMVEGLGLSELYIAPHSETRGEQMLRVIGQLSLCDRVTSIDLKINLSNSDDSMFSGLGKYIESTVALKKFCLCLTYDTIKVVPDAKTNRFWALVLQSLCQNKSIREVSMQNGYVKEELVKNLTDVIKTSQNICKISFCTSVQRLANAFIRGLYESITDNYKLIEVTLRHRYYHIEEKEWFAVSSVARRNFGLVTQAAQYVTGAACDRRRAQALERVSRYPTLIEEVAKLASISKTEAAAKIQARLRSLESMHDYMRGTGVIKEKVVCHTRRDGRTQLDDLNVYCWSRVRHYLLLEDVREAPASSATEPTQHMCGDEQQ